MPREWDAAGYDAQPLPHLEWGRRTVRRLDPAPDATVMDAGCGTGRDAALLLDLLPAGRVVAVDGSVRMLERLRDRLSDRLDRVDVIHADLARPLPPGLQVDAILSVAAFHWIADHAALFANLAAVLRPGGRLAVDCGGQGQLAAVTAAVDDVLARRSGAPPDPWEFAGVEETRQRLARAGFVDLDVRLTPRPARFEDHDRFRDYLRTVVLGGHLDAMPPDERDSFVTEVAALLTDRVVDYVRLEITATRG